MRTLLSFKPPTFDVAAGYANLRPLVAAARRQDAEAVVAAYQAIDGWDGRYLAAKALGGDRRHGAFLRQASADNLDSTAIRTLLACWTIDEGWRIRTALRARHVSRKRFAAFHGLQLGVSEARRRYDQVGEQDPHFLPAQSQLLQQLCPKWGGSFEQLFAFARGRADAAPEGALNPRLVVDAHLEYWMENGVAVPFRRRPAVSYLRRRDVVREVDEASAKMTPPRNVGTEGWVAAYNAFAMFYATTWRYRSAKVYFKALGHYANKQPWAYLGGIPGVVVGSARARTMILG
jgi:hypothetical protein